MIPLLLFSLLLVTSLSSHLIELEFLTIETSSEDNISLFYYDTNQEAMKTIQLLDSIIDDITLKYPLLKYYKCNGNNNVNYDLFNEAGFERNKYYIFIQVDQEIDLYNHEIDSSIMIEHINSLYTSSQSNHLIEFRNEILFNEDTLKKPIMVNYVTPNCIPCDALTKSVNRYSALFQNNVTFMTIDCSTREENIDFCMKNKVISYPSFALFTAPNEKVQYDSIDRTFTSMKKFLSKHLNM